MSARASRPNEILLIFIMTLLGAGLMWGTVFLFEQDWLLGGLITKVDGKAWISEQYSRWATFVFGISTFSTILWYVFACFVTVPTRGHETDKQMRLVWAGFSVLPLITTVAFVFFNTNKEVEWLCIFFFIVISCCGYWLSTALNSPAPFQYIPPLSQELRQLFRIS